MLANTQRRRGKTPGLVLPLLTTIVPTKGVVIPTFTRASTQPVLDFEGISRTAKNHEARFKSAIGVENLIPNTGTRSASLAVGANKTMTLAAGTYCFSMGAGSGIATFSGTSGATGTLIANTTKRTSVLMTVSAGTLLITASVATLIDLQVENVTGKSNQNPSEYVSNGVPVGLVGNELVRSVNNVVSDWTQSLGIVTAYGTTTSGSVSFNLITPTVIGKSYSISIPNSITGGSFYVDLGPGTIASQVGNLPNSANQVVILTAQNATSLVRVGRWTGNPLGNIGPITMKETVYHGANVDGVKYFDTYNGNTVANNVVTEATGAKLPDLKGCMFDATGEYLTINTAAYLSKSKGTLLFSFYKLAGATGNDVIFGSYVDANNYTRVIDTGSQLIFRKRVAGVNYDATFDIATAVGNKYSVAIRFDGRGSQIFVSGVAGTANTNALPAKLGATFNVGADGQGTNQAMASIFNVVAYKAALADSKLLELTTTYIVDDTGELWIDENGDYQVEI